MRSWIVVLKAYFDAPDYATALVAAEATRQNACRDLEVKDEVDVAIVLPLGADENRIETVALLRRARNSLIKLGHQRAVDVAREVDMIAEILSVPQASLDMHAPYDYGRFLQVMNDIMKGKDPGI